MVHLEGTFPSFFTGKTIPPRVLPEPTAARGAAADPLAEPIGGAAIAPPEQPVTTQPQGEPPPPSGEKPPHGPQEPASDPARAAQEPAPAAEPPPAAPESAAGEASQEPAEEPTEEQDKEQDKEPVFKAPATAKLTVIGDATFLRDDLRPVAGQAGVQSAEYGPMGPTSLLVQVFFVNLLDWLAGDEDLLELRNLKLPDRALHFAPDQLQVERDQYLAETARRERLLTLLNWVGPPLAIFVLWLAATLRRRARKQSFLASVQS
jgi:hypothetical protein